MYKTPAHVFLRFPRSGVPVKLVRSDTRDYITLDEPIPFRMSRLPLHRYHRCIAGRISER
jgi:hypothetical protein